MSSIIDPIRCLSARICSPVIFANRGPELSRALRGLPFWISMKTHGAAKFGQMVDKNIIQAKGRRKDGRADMQGKGTWYVTKKGKLCIELKAGGVDENWCRHVFKVGEGYYASKDLRPERSVYRFVLADR